MEKVSGTVKWFSDGRGYGFIAPDGGDKDIFVHFTNINMEGYKRLKEGQRVEFEIGEIEGKGKNALDVTPLDD